MNFTFMDSLRFYLTVGGISVVLLMWMLFVAFRGSLMSSEDKWKHAIGAGLCHKHFILLLLLVPMITLFPQEPAWEMFNDLPFRYRFWCFLILLVTVSIVIDVANSLKKVCLHDDRMRRDTFNFKVQTVILCSIGVLVVGTVIVFHITGSNFILFGIMGTILTWVTQDMIKGVIAFYTLSMNGMLHIGDWVEITSRGIEGEIKDISLTTVVISNGDNTLSSIPTSAIQADHLRNWQKMLDGKTSGRRMLKTFTFDLSSVKVLDANQIEEIRNRLAALDEDTITLENHDAPVLNLQLYRLYLLHWLMNNGKVFREPRLVVRILDQTPEGIPLQVYAFLTDTGLQAYEFLQSSMIEHMIQSMEWFGLRLYQRPSAHDFKELA
ncbi:MAG: mechanosensitive ion channel domain-containing protein [Candidatus Cryptobacteroides sp.]